METNKVQQVRHLHPGEKNWKKRSGKNPESTPFNLEDLVLNQKRLSYLKVLTKFQLYFIFRIAHTVSQKTEEVLHRKSFMP